MFLEPAINGEFPKELEEILTNDGVIWQTELGDSDILKTNTMDFLGVNFYHPNRVKAPDIAPNSVGDWLPNRYYDEYKMPGRRMNIDKGWQIYPEAIYDIAINIRDNYKNIPWFVSENGMGFLMRNVSWTKMGKFRMTIVLTLSKNTLLVFIEESKKVQIVLDITFGHQLIVGLG